MNNYKKKTPFSFTRDYLEVLMRKIENQCFDIL